MRRRFLIAAVLIAVVVLTPVVLLLQVVEDGVVLASPPAGENYLWISDDDDFIYQVTTADPETIVDNYDFGTGRPFGLEENDGYIYFVDYADDVLYKKLWSDKTEDNQWDISGYCVTAYGVAYGGGYFWVANRGSDEIYKVDPADPTNYVGIFDYTGIGYVSGLDWNSDNNRLLVSDDGSELFYSFDVSTVPDNGDLVTLAPDWTKSPPASAPTGIVWDGTYFWSIDDGTNLLYKHYDNGDVIQSYDPPGGDPQGLAFRHMEWNLIETWTGTVQAAPAEWQLIETWTGTVEAPVAWQLIETWAGTIEAPVAWNLIETWSGAIKTNWLPIIENVYITDMDNIAVSELNPQVPYKFWVEVQDNDGLGHVDEVWLKLYENTLSESDNDAVENHYTFRWTRTGGDWETEQLDTAAPYMITITLDENGNPHIVWQTSLGGGYYRIKYASWDGSWTIENVYDDAAYGGTQHSALVLDNQGRAHIVTYGYGSPNRFAYVWENDDGWQSENIDVWAASSYQSGIVLDENQNPHVVYRSNDYPRNLVYAYKNNGTWTKENVSDNFRLGNCSIALDENQRPHIACDWRPVYDADDNSWIRYAYHDGTSWNIEDIDNGHHFTGEYGATIALDSNWKPHIVYTWDNAEIDLDVRYASKTGAAWVVEVIEAEGMQQFSDIAIDANDIPHVTYDTDDWLLHAYKPEGLWVIENTNLSGSVTFMSIDVDSSGMPHLSYRAGSNIYYTKKTSAFLEVGPDNTSPYAHIVVENSVAGQDNLKIDNLVFCVKLENANSSNWNVWVKVVDNQDDQDNQEFVNKFTLRNWQLVETWNGTIKAPIEWDLIETWSGTVNAPVEWQLTEQWTGTIEAFVEWQLVESWDGTIKNPYVAQWNLIETWNGTIETPVEWQTIETWAGTIEAPVAWQLVETWGGTVKTNWGPIIENVYITDMDNVTANDLTPQTQYKFWVELWDNDTLANIENVKLKVYLDNENLSDAPENHYTFRWTKESGFEETNDPNFGYEIKGVNEWSHSADFIIGSEYGCTEAGTATSITVYLKQKNTLTPNIKFAIYKASDASLVGYTEEWTVTSGWDGEKTLNIVSGGALEATDYYLAFWNDDSVYTYYTALTDSCAYDAETYGTWPNPWVQASLDDRSYTIYCTYTPTPAGHLIVENCENFDNTKTRDNIIFTFKFGENATITENDNWDVWVQVYDNSGDQDNKFFLNKFDIVSVEEWQLIETWLGTVQAPVEWNLIETWAGTIEAPVAWQLVETWGGTVKTNWGPIIENVYITDMDNVTANDLTPQTQYKFWVEIVDNDTLADIENVTLVLYLDNENLPDNEADHYTFRWTKDGGFEEIGPDPIGDGGNPDSSSGRLATAAPSPFSNVFGNLSLPDWKDVTVENTLDFIIVNNADNLIFKFRKGTTGYNEIWQGDTMIVADERWIVEHLFKPPDTWQTRGEPQYVEWEQPENYHAVVKRFYRDWGEPETTFWVIYDFYGGFRPKISVEISVGQADNYRIAWKASGINKTHVENKTNYVRFWNEGEEAICFDYMDVYERFGNITEVEIEEWAGNHKLNEYFNVGALGVGGFKLDPNFGYETKGGTSHDWNNYIYGSWFTITEDGTADSISAYVITAGGGASDGKMKYAIYAYVADDDAGILVGQTEEKTDISPNFNGWLTLNFSEPKPQLSADTKYFLLGWGAKPSSAGIYGYFNAGADKGIYKTETYDGWEDPLTGETGVGQKHSIYCSYTPGAAPPGKPVLYLPADNSTTKDSTPYFEWTLGENAENHRLLVDDDDGFGSPNENRIIVGDNYYTIADENSLPYDTYYWKVVAENGANKNDSDTWSFEIKTYDHLVLENCVLFDNTKTIDNIVFAIKFHENAQVTTNDNWDVWVQVYDSSGEQDNEFFLNRFDIVAAAQWQLIETWTGTIESYAEWQLIETWTGTIQAPAVWQLTEQWTGTIEAYAEWQIVETWTGTVQAPAAWGLIETWSGTIEAPSAWQLIEAWTGTIEAPAVWQTIETWTGNIEAYAGWQLIETWIGTIKSPVVNIVPVVENVYITDMDNVTANDLTPQTQYKFWVKISDNDTLSDIENVKLMIYLDNENLSDAPENHYTFKWTRDDGFEEEVGPYPTVVGTSTTYDAVGYPYQRKMLYDEWDNIWFFYANGTNMVYKVSNDGGITWSGETTVRTCVRGRDFSIEFDGENIHYAAIYLGNLYYRKGKAEENGSIGWYQDEQTVYLKIEGIAYFPTTTNLVDNIYELSTSAPPSENLDTVVTVGTYGNENIFIINPFENTTTPIGTTLPSEITLKGWRSANPISAPPENGGRWDIDFAMTNVGNMGHVGTLWIRVWKSTNADMSGAESLCDWEDRTGFHFVGGIDNENEYVNARIDSFPITVDDEYIYVEFAWEVTGENLDASTAVAFKVRAGNANRIFTPNYEAKSPTIAVESGGRPWIAWGWFFSAGGTAFKDPYVVRSTTTDGTWVTDNGNGQFPIRLTQSVGSNRPNVVSLTEGKMYALYGAAFTVSKGRLWDGSSWGELEESMSDLEDMYGYSIVTEGDNIHVVFSKDFTYDLIYNKRVYGSGWQTENIIYAGTDTDYAPALTIEPSTGDLFCFWYDDPLEDKVYYIKWTASTGSWDASETFWYHEENGFYSTYSQYLTSSTGNMGDEQYGLAWASGTAAPYNVVFGLFAGGSSNAYLVVENCENFDNTLTTDNIIFTIKFDEDAQVTDSDNWDVWVQVYDSSGDQDNEFFLNKFDIVSAAEWNLVETWTGTVEAPAAWQTIETWTGTVEAITEWMLIEEWTGTVESPVGWSLIEEWSGAIEAPAAWQLIEEWSGTVEAPAAWVQIETWSGTIQAPSAWTLVETWDGTVEALAQWQLIEEWNGAIEAPSVWNLIETWDGTIIAPAQWELIETWTATIEAYSGWVLLETWDGIIEARAEWTQIEEWVGTIESPAVWDLIETWTATIQAPAEWQLISTWGGDLQAPSAWSLIETWAGTVQTPAAWGLIETWSGTIEAPSAWQLIETWSGTVEAPVGWQLIETWIGTIEAYVEWQLIETWTGTVEAPAVVEWNLVESWSGTIEAFAEWQLIETWTGTIQVPIEWLLIETWVGTVKSPSPWQLIETWTGTVSTVGWRMIEMWTGTIRSISLAKVTTESATSVSTTSATLNATILYGSYASVNVQFEYRIVGGTWMETSWEVGYTQADYSKEVSGLSTDTNYEFKAHITYDAQENYGTVKIFKTESTYVPPGPIPIPIPVPTPTPLVYDILLRVVPSEVTQGEEIELSFDVWQVSGTGVHDVVLEYWITGPPDNKIYVQKLDTQAISARVIEKSIDTDGWSIGSYLASARVTWANGIAESSESFEITMSWWAEHKGDIMSLVVIIIVLVIVAIGVAGKKKATAIIIGIKRKLFSLAFYKLIHGVQVPALRL